MRLTPLDIHHKEFRHAIRGYSEEEVDNFLDEVANEFERLFKENIDYKEGLEQTKEKVVQYENLEDTLHNTLLTAHKAAEEVQRSAKKEAELIIRDAELKAKEIVQNAVTEKQYLQTNLINLKQAEEEFRLKFKSLLESYLKMMSETPAEGEKVSALVEERESAGEKQVMAEEKLVTETSASPATETSTAEPHYLMPEEKMRKEIPLEKEETSGFEDLGDEEDLIYRID